MSDTILHRGWPAKCFSQSLIELSLSFSVNAMGRRIDELERTVAHLISETEPILS